MRAKLTTDKLLLYGFILTGLVILLVSNQFRLPLLDLLESIGRGNQTPKIAESISSARAGDVHTLNMQSTFQLASESDAVTIQTAAIRDAVAMVAGPPCDVVDCANTGMPFTVSGSSSPPGVVTTTSPNGSIISTQPTYTWDDEGVATDYLVMIYDADAAVVLHYIWYVASTVCDAGTSVCDVTPAVTLTTGTNYRWWVKGSNSSGIGPWSAPKNFIVTNGNISPPGVVNTISPNVSTTSTQPPYTWNDEGTATDYLIMIYDVDSAAVLHYVWYVASTVCDAGTSVCNVTPSVTLTTGTNYRWWVKGSNSGGIGPWSAPEDFVVTNGNVSPPGVVTTISPNVSTTSTQPPYTWNDEGTATDYLVMIYDVDSAVVLHYIWYVASTVCDAGTGICDVTPSVTLTTGTNYRWWVKGSNSGGIGSWSAPEDFVVTSLVVAANVNEGFNNKQLSTRLFIPIITIEVTTADQIELTIPSLSPEVIEEKILTPTEIEQAFLHY